MTKTMFLSCGNLGIETQNVKVEGLNTSAGGGSEPAAWSAPWP